MVVVVVVAEGDLLFLVHRHDNWFNNDNLKFKKNLFSKKRIHRIILRLCVFVCVKEREGEGDRSKRIFENLVRK